MGPHVHIWEAGSGSLGENSLSSAELEIANIFCSRVLWLVVTDTSRFAGTPLFGNFRLDARKVSESKGIEGGSNWDHGSNREAF